MAEWIFYEYITASQKSPYRHWRDDLPPAAQAAVDSMMKVVMMQSRIERPDWAWLKKDGEGLIEIRAKDSHRTQYRIIACHGRDVDSCYSKSIFLLGGLVEKGWKFKGKNSLDAMQQRKRDLIKFKRFVEWEE